MVVADTLKFVVVALVKVAFAEVKFVNAPVRAVKIAEKKLVVVASVIDALDVKRFVEVEFVSVAFVVETPDIFRFAILALIIFAVVIVPDAIVVVEIVVVPTNAVVPLFVKLLRDVEASVEEPATLRLVT